MMKHFEKNLKYLTARFPELARKLKSEVAFDDVKVVRADDGGICYAARHNGAWKPLSPPGNPVSVAQQVINTMGGNITSGFSPVIIVGFYPGYLLETVFRHFSGKEPFRHIYVAVDNMECFAGWLKAADRSPELTKPEVIFFFATDMDVVISACEKDDNRSHMFTVLSCLSPGELKKIIMPVERFYRERLREQRRWHKENNDYYNKINDDELASVISGKNGRKPRLLIPAHVTSTVCRFSARDTCRAFEKAGWDTRILSIEQQLTPWRMTKELNKFRPDVLLFIDHLRTEDGDLNCYPDNLMFVTWVQDAMSAINSEASAEEWNKRVSRFHRDLIVGYTGQLKVYGYIPERLEEIPMVVNPEIFNPEASLNSSDGKYFCDVCFASNQGDSTEYITEKTLIPFMDKFGYGAKEVKKLHDRMIAFYDSGGTLINYFQLEEFLISEPEFSEIYDSHSGNTRNELLQKIFWILNDPVYRHTVLKWCVDMGLKLNLYGKNWERHSVFSRFSRGVIEHGIELSNAYRGADYSLHLNSMEGFHQRPVEILFSGGRVLTRFGNKLLFKEKVKLGELFRKIISERLFTDNDRFSPAENESFNDFLFFLMSGFISENPEISFNELKSKMETTVFNEIAGFELPFLFSRDRLDIFNSREDFEAFFRETSIDGNTETLSPDGFVGKFHNFQTVNKIINAALRILNMKATVKVSLEPERRVLELGEILNRKNSLPKEILEAYRNIENPGASIALSVARKLTLWREYNTAGEIIAGIDPESLTGRTRVLLYAETLLMRNDEAEVLDFLNLIYSKYPSLNNLFVQLSWQYYYARRFYEEAFRLAANDFDSERINSDWLPEYCIIRAAAGNSGDLPDISVPAGKDEGEFLQYFALGAFQRGDFEKAGKLFEKALLLSDSGKLLYPTNMATCRCLSGDIAGAAGIAVNNNIPFYKVVSAFISSSVDFNIKDRRVKDYSVLGDFLRKDPVGGKTEANTLINVVRMCLKQDEFEEAYREFKKALKLFPGERQRIMVISAFHAAVDQQFEYAARFIQGCQTEVAGSPLELFCAGVVFNFSGNLEEGVKYFRKLYSKNPLFFSFPDLVTWRWILYYAMALYKFGHVKKASECFARVRKNTRAGFYHRKHIDRVLAEEPPGCLDVPEFIMPWS